jgi:hypothetical protein
MKMATKKTSYFAKVVLVDGEKKYKVGEEVKLTDAQAKRLLDADAVSKSESDVEGTDEGGTDNK